MKTIRSLIEKLEGVKGIFNNDTIDEFIRASKQIFKTKSGIVNIRKVNGDSSEIDDFIDIDIDMPMGKAVKPAKLKISVFSDGSVDVISSVKAIKNSSRDINKPAFKYDFKKPRIDNIENVADLFTQVSEFFGGWMRD